MITWVLFVPFVCAFCLYSVTCNFKSIGFIQSDTDTHWIELIYGFWPHQFFYFSVPRKTNYVSVIRMSGSHLQLLSDSLAWAGAPVINAGQHVSCAVVHFGLPCWFSHFMKNVTCPNPQRMQCLWYVALCCYCPFQKYTSFSFCCCCFKKISPESIGTASPESQWCYEHWSLGTDGLKT